MIRRDLLDHLEAGSLAALYGAGVSLLFFAFGLIPVLGVGVGSLVAASTAATTKEKADRMENKADAAKGLAASHEVSVLDWLFTTAPGVLVLLITALL